MAVDLAFDDEFCVITLNRPEALNALNADVITKLGEAFETAAASDARCVIITGAGDKAFCAGADIKELTANSTLQHKQMLQRGQRTLSRLADLPIPSIAAINGYAFGGGLETALACTFRLATPNAKVGLPEVKLGMVPGYGGTQRLPRIVGETRALEIIMSGRTVGAEEALDIGLVSQIVEDDVPGGIVEGAKAFARNFTGYGLPILKMLRDAVMRAGDLPLHEGLAAEADLGALSFATEDGKEGIAAFVEKRAAVIKDC
ncbi:MAG: enoyl-CoA hydratase [Rhodospirillaceae bacterium]|nr:enoyl-CoA hydratase [Rhodospirillaceae bacterium]